MTTRQDPSRGPVPVDHVPHGQGDCCCSATKDVILPNKPGAGLWKAPMDRRRFLQGAAGVAAAAGLPGFWSHRAKARTPRTVQLAFCSQLLCVVPYEVAHDAGFFAAEGLDVELVYTRGGGAAMQALVGGAVDYAATSFDVALQAFARDAEIVRFASTGRLPLFALATSPGTAGEIQSIEDLPHRMVGVSALGNADHTLLLYLLHQSGIDPATVEFAALGTNLFEALNRGHVDAGMVQEPALSLVVAEGGQTLVNFMDLAHSQEHLGGAYEFMGIAVRQAQRAERLEEMQALGRAIERALVHIHGTRGEQLVEALPRELVAGGDAAQLAVILDEYRRSLYPEEARIDVASARRVAESQKVAGLLAEDFQVEGLLDLEVLG